MMVYNNIYCTWSHRTKLKCIVNPVLRCIQFWTDRPWVIASVVEYGDDGGVDCSTPPVPVFIKYKIARVKLLF